MYTTTVNEVKILGYVPRKPKLREASNGSMFCGVNIATNRTFIDKHGEIHKRTDWLPVMFWDRLAIIANEFLEKGNKVYIEGRLDTYSKIRNSEEVFETKVFATKIIVLDKNNSHLRDKNFQR